MTALLKITDGTTTISLLNKRGFGFVLGRWRPAIAAYKGGGLFQSSPLVGGRRLVSRRFDNAIETFNLKANDVDQDTLIRSLQEIRRLLEKAAEYWVSDWQTGPVWLEARATGETNTRYAIIHTGRIPEDENPFSQPFLQSNCAAMMDNLTLLIERGHWQDTTPSESTAVEISALEAYDGRNLGNVDTTGARQPTIADVVYVANKRNIANLTNIHYWNGVAWSVNLMNVGLPFDLFQTPVLADDVIVFGIDTAKANSGPFCSLVFDLATAQNHLTITWKYSSVGPSPTANWATLAAQDNTNNAGAMTGQAFNTTGVGSVHWSQTQNPVFDQRDPTEAAVVLGVTGFWVAAHVTAVGATPTPPAQQNRDIYSVVWPYTEIDDLQVAGGDIPVISQTQFHNRSDRSGTGEGIPVEPTLYANRVICGLRSLRRDGTPLPRFSPYLNIGNNVQNDASVAIGIPPGANTAFAANPASASGDSVVYTPAGAETMNLRLTISLGSPALRQAYQGIFHVYLRARQLGGVAGDIAVQFRLTQGWGYVLEYSDAKVFNNLNDFQLIDFGKFTINSGRLYAAGESSELVAFDLLASSTGAGPTLHMYDLILMPVDEWAADFVDHALTLYSMVGHIGRGALRDRLLDIDSITNPKINLRGLVRDVVTGLEQVTSVYQVISPEPAMLQTRTDQRLWFLTAKGILTGAHDDINNQPTLRDLTVNFSACGIKAGMYVYNVTDGSYALITNVTTTTVVGALTGGVDDDWDTNDVYFIMCPNWQSDPYPSHSLRLHKSQRYLSARGDR